MKDTNGGTKQLSFRLPKSLVDRVDRCVRECESSGLDLTRADVVRLLLNYALTATGGKLDQLIDSRVGAPKGGRKRVG
jgi:hypothetical protein